MKEKLYTDFIYNSSYAEVYLVVLLYFMLLYFGLAPVFRQACIWLESKKLLNKIVDKKVENRQTRFEILHSLKSVFIFGFSGIPIIYLIRNGGIELIDDSLLNVLWGVLLLNIWNELHFFVVHRIMHTRFFMKRVHFIHHRSTIPTVYSVYSFH